MGCGCGQNKAATFTVPAPKPKTVVVIPGHCSEPSYLTDLETKLLCMANNKVYTNSSQQEVNMLLGQIGTMRNSGNYCQFDLTLFHNKLQHVECQLA